MVETAVTVVIDKIAVTMEMAETGVKVQSLHSYLVIWNLIVLSLTTFHII